MPVEIQSEQRRDALKKILVGGAIVWAAPTISSVASAQALPSGCVLQTLDWEPFSTGAVFSSTTIGGVLVSMSSTFSGTTAMSRNFTVQPSPHGGINGKSLMFEQVPQANTGGQTITITFGASVRNVSFTLTDIDNQAGDWSDRVTLVTAPSTATPGSQIIGIGASGNGTGSTPDSGNGGGDTNTGAYRNNANDQNLNDNSSAGNLALSYYGPLTTISFRYWCGSIADADSNQRINLSDVTFYTCP